MAWNIHEVRFKSYEQQPSLPLRLKTEAGVTKSLNANNFIMTGYITNNLMTSSADAIASAGHMVER